MSESESCLCLMSTRRLKFLRKSAPSIGCLTSATMNIHGKTRWSPKLRVRDCLPYVGIGNPLAASRVNSVAREVRFIGGIKLTSAPVSTRKWRFELLSRM